LILEFLSRDRTGVDGRFAPVARSPLERHAREAGARFEERDGWRVATHFGKPEDELQRCHTSAGFGDRSALGKLELQAEPAELPGLAGARLELSAATRVEDGWWCPLTPERALRLVEPAGAARVRSRLEEAASGARGPASVVDLTAGFAALSVVGPLAREVLARLTALDLRPAVTPPGAFRPGSVARVPGMVVCEAPNSYLLLVGAAHAHYMWTALSDAAGHLGGGPVGAVALARLEAPMPEAARA
jgi:heterotetrameric sarcosine oxidase gamma subunit